MKKNSLPPRILGLLLKKAMSQTDLAKEIYNNPNARSGIDKCIKIFLKEGIISKRATNRKTILYTYNLETLGDFNKKEYQFIQLIIERFWNPKTNSSIENLKELILNAIIIKKGYTINKKLFSYNPSRDFKIYQKNKKLFWENKQFRDNFLNNIKETERRLKRSKSFSLNRDYLFCCFLSPKNLFNKIKGNYSNRKDSSFIAIKVLNDLKD